MIFLLLIGSKISDICTVILLVDVLIVWLFPTILSTNLRSLIQISKRSFCFNNRITNFSNIIFSEVKILEIWFDPLSRTSNLIDKLPFTVNIVLYIAARATMIIFTISIIILRLKTIFPVDRIFVFIALNLILIRLFLYLTLWKHRDRTYDRRTNDEDYSYRLLYLLSWI